MPFPKLLLCALMSTAVFAQAPDRTELLLQHLADAPGPPGFEEPVRALIVAEMKPFATEPLR